MTRYRICEERPRRFTVQFRMSGLGWLLGWGSFGLLEGSADFPQHNRFTPRTFRSRSQAERFIRQQQAEDAAPRRCGWFS